MFADFSPNLTITFRLPMKNALCLIVCVFVLWGCNNPSDQKTVAEGQVQKYFSVVNDNPDSTLQLFDEYFFKDVTKQRFRDVLSEIKRDHGAVVKFELVQSKTGFNSNSEQNVTYLDLGYRVTFSSGYVADQRFTFFTNDKNFELIDGMSFYKWGNTPE